MPNVKYSSDSMVFDKFIALLPIKAGDIVMCANHKIGIALKDCEVGNTLKVPGDIDTDDFCPFTRPIPGSPRELIYCRS